MDRQFHDAGEVQRAVEALSQSDHLRLGAVARILRSRDQLDLVQEALAKTLEGKRRWRHGKTLCDHLIDVMRSMASNLAKKKDENLAELPNGGEVPAISSQDPSQERAVLAKEKLDEICARLQDDRLALDVLQCWLGECRGPDTKRALGISEMQYRAAVKRIRRAAGNNPKQGTEGVRHG